ncbi:hypothetical protein [Sphingomonas sp. R-74633]|uniref:hypothetical protein n=1 Tax=Sphingomonas sp. R-74633 TaxID=2751188 RepID=UPI0015D3EA1C|nr:hypothetical protein [Sphingomonas sp. R-74633]
MAAKQNQVAPSDAVDRLIADIEAKWEAAHRASSSSAERQEYTAAAHWGAPKLIAEVRRLRGDLG